MIEVSRLQGLRNENPACILLHTGFMVVCKLSYRTKPAVKLPQSPWVKINVRYFCNSSIVGNEVELCMNL